MSNPKHVVWCPYCGRGFTRKENLDRHVNNVRCPVIKTGKLNSQDEKVMHYNELSPQELEIRVKAQDQVISQQAQEIINLKKLVEKQSQMLTVADSPQGNVVIDQSVNNTTNTTINNIIIVVGSKDLAELLVFNQTKDIEEVSHEI